MKQNIKVGDWIKLSHWREFFEVTYVGEYEIEFRTQDGKYSAMYYKSDNWIIKEKEQPMKIDMNKKYRRVGTHEPVRVICVDAKGNFPVIYLQETASISAVAFLDSFGFNGCGTQVIEEVPAVDWSKVKMDTPMWVSFFGGSGTWHKRHFNKFDGKRVHFWPNGYTSFTSCQTCDANSELPEQCSLEEPK